MAAIQAVKSEWRKTVQQSLKRLTNDEIAARSYKIHQSLFALPEYQEARNISIYLSMPTGEVSTKAIVEDALSKGKTVFVPYLHKMCAGDGSKGLSVMDMVSLKSEADYDSLQPDKWGIPTPDKASVADRFRILGESEHTGTNEDCATKNMTLDLMIMPGVAFDCCARRLGHGKGYYDFFLHRYHERRLYLSKNRSSETSTMPFLGEFLIYFDKMSYHTKTIAHPT